MVYISSSRGPMYKTIGEILSKYICDNYKILEPGCGSGLISLEVFLNFKGIEVTLLDINQEILNKAINNFQIHGGNIYKAVIGSVEDLHQFSENHFDFVFNEGVLEHDPIDVKKAIREMLRVSKRYVLIAIPSGDNIIYRFKKWLKRKLKMWEWDKYGYERSIGEKYFKEFCFEKTKTNQWSIYLIRKH